MLCIAFRTLCGEISIQSIFTFSSILCALTTSIIACKQLIYKENAYGNYDSSVGMSITLVLGILSSLYYIIDKKNINMSLKIGLYIFAICSSAIILISHSRVGICALGLGCILLIKKRKLVYLSLILTIIACLTLADKDKLSSTQGRSFILKTTASLLDTPTKVIFGYGENGFISNYMNAQAIMLSKEGDNSKQLADNIIHPLNEFMLLCVKYGAISIILPLIICLRILTNPKVNSYPKAVLISLLTFALFSYPSRYPISWIAFAYVISVDLSNGRFNHNIHPNIFGFYVMAICSIITLSLTYKYGSHLKCWKDAHNNALIGRTHKALLQYENLEDCLNTPDFLYNYSSFLLNSGKYYKALEVLNKSNLRDYETTLLKGQIYEALGENKRAILNFNMAASMCPNRFIPLFEIYKIHKKNGNESEKMRMAEVITHKQIKIPSSDIDYIINTIQMDKQLNINEKIIFFYPLVICIDFFRMRQLL